jgi:hypothetical protein
MLFCAHVLFQMASDGKLLTAWWDWLQVLLIGLKSPLIAEDAYVSYPLHDLIKLEVSLYGWVVVRT